MAACAVAVPALTFYFQALAAVLGPALATVFVEIDLRSYYTPLMNSLTLREVVMSLAKTGCFGLVIAATACACGWRRDFMRTLCWRRRGLGRARRAPKMKPRGQRVRGWLHGRLRRWAGRRRH